MNLSHVSWNSLRVPVEADPDEVLGHVGDALEELLGEVDLEVGRGDVAQRLLVGVAAEGGESGEEDVGEHAQAPDVRRQRDRLQTEDLGRCKSTISV